MSHPVTNTSRDQGGKAHRAYALGIRRSEIIPHLWVSPPPRFFKSAIPKFLPTSDPTIFFYIFAFTLLLKNLQSGREIDFISRILRYDEDYFLMYVCVTV